MPQNRMYYIKTQRDKEVNGDDGCVITNKKIVGVHLRFKKRPNI